MSQLNKKMAVAGLALCAAAACATFADAQIFRFRFEGPDRRGASEGKRAACEVYARIAVVQAEMNQKYRCGYTDPRWNTDLGAHFRWCRFVRRDVLWQSQKSRADDLQRCFDQLTSEASEDREGHRFDWRRRHFFEEHREYHD